MHKNDLCDPFSYSLGQQSELKITENLILNSLQKMQRYFLKQLAFSSYEIFDWLSATYPNFERSESNQTRITQVLLELAEKDRVLVMRIGSKLGELELEGLYPTCIKYYVKIDDDDELIPNIY